RELYPTDVSSHEQRTTAAQRHRKKTTPRKKAVRNRTVLGFALRSSLLLLAAFPFFLLLGAVSSLCLCASVVRSLSSRIQHAPLEHLDRHAGTGDFQAFQTLGADAGREEVPLGQALLVHPGLLETEEVVHAHDLAFHAGDLRDLHELADAAGQAGDLHH